MGKSTRLTLSEQAARRGIEDAEANAICQFTQAHPSWDRRGGLIYVIDSYPNDGSCGFMQAVTNNTGLAGFFPATAMPNPDWWQVLWPQPQQVLAALGVRPDMEVVDLCCGDGLFTAPLALMVRRVIGIDIDPGMLALARMKLAAVGATNCDLIEGDGYAVAELVRRPVDFVLIANTFHGVPDKPRLARGVAAILKSGGRFAIINWHHRPREETTVLGQPRGPKTEMRMKPSDVSTEVEPANLKLVSVIELPPYHYGAIFENPVH